MEDRERMPDENDLARREQALTEREEALDMRQRQALARELLQKSGLPMEAMPLMDLASPQTLEGSLAALEGLRRAMGAGQAPRIAEESAAPQTYRERLARYLAEHSMY